MVRLQFLGTGDASASGGRYFTSFFVQTPNVKFLIDCGATVINSIKKFNLDHKDIDAVFLTHFHGDHFARAPL